MTRPLILLMLLFAGCDGNVVDKSTVDQCMRREIAMQCISSAIGQQTHTVTNGPSDVVNECQSMAYYQSLRRYSQIKPECRP